MSLPERHQIDLTAGPYRLEWQGGRYAVVGPGDQLVRQASRSLDVAISALTKVADAANRKRRSCLCCDETFLSLSAHNRLCDRCRRKS